MNNCNGATNNKSFSVRSYDNIITNLAEGVASCGYRVRNLEGIQPFFSENCDICIVSYKEKINKSIDTYQVALTACGHNYDISCLIQWIINNNNDPSCPTCRTPIEFVLFFEELKDFINTLNKCDTKNCTECNNNEASVQNYKKMNIQELLLKNRENCSLEQVENQIIEAIQKYRESFAGDRIDLRDELDDLICFLGNIDENCSILALIIDVENNAPSDQIDQRLYSILNRLRRYNETGLVF